MPLVTSLTRDITNALTRPQAQRKHTTIHYSISKHTVLDPNIYHTHLNNKTMKRQAIVLTTLVITLIINVIEFISSRNITAKDMAEVMNGVVNNI